MTKCHLFVNDFTSQKIRSELLDNKLESEILEWCCPVELCVMMEIVLCPVHYDSHISTCDYMHLICGSANRGSEFYINLKLNSHT